MSTAAAGAAGGGGTAGGASQGTASLFNTDFSDFILIVLSSLAVSLIIWRVGIESVKYVRTLTCLSNNTQKYFSIPSKPFASFKKHVLYAPIFRKRHNREFQLSSAVNVGTLPTRLQLAFLTAYVGMNVAFCVVHIDWSGETATIAQDLRNRAGTLAVTNLVSLLCYDQ